MHKCFNAIPNPALTPDENPDARIIIFWAHFGNITGYSELHSWVNLSYSLISHLGELHGVGKCFAWMPLIGINTLITHKKSRAV
jgi:hypothetical protein